MKKKLLSVLFSIAVVVTMTPSMAFAANDAGGVDEGGKKVVEKTEELTMKGSGSENESEKTEVEITGVKIAGIEYDEDYGCYTKMYDGKAVSYEGTPVAKTSDDKEVNIGEFKYEWKKLVPTGEDYNYNNVPIESAPKNVGKYVLVVSVPEENENYTGEVRLYFDIYPMLIEVSGIEVESKTYDGNTTATITKTPQISELEGIVSGDNVSVNTDGLKAEFYDKNAEEGKEVKITGYNLVGDDADNYELTIDERADITPKDITITDSITLQERAYNGFSYVKESFDITDKVKGVEEGDRFKLFVDGEMENSDVGKNKPVKIKNWWTEGYEWTDDDGKHYVNDGDNYNINMENITVNIIPAKFNKNIVAKKLIKKTGDEQQKESVYFNNYIDYIDDANITDAKITEGTNVIENVKVETVTYGDDGKYSEDNVVSFDVKNTGVATIDLTIKSRNYETFTETLKIEITDKDIVFVDFKNVGDLTYGEKRTVTASAIYEDKKLSGGSWTWESSKPEVLSVTPDINDSSKAVIEGKNVDYRGVNAGVTITATYSYGSYVGLRSESDICVYKKAITIKPKDIEIFVGDEIPELNNCNEATGENEAKDGTYTVEGLINGDSLKGKLFLDYCIVEDGYLKGGIEPDNTKAGTYTIVAWYNDSADDNYEMNEEDHFGTLTIKERPSQDTPVTPAPEKEEPKVEYDADGNKITTETTTDKATGTTTEKIKTEKKDGTVIEQVVVKNDKEGTSSSVTTTKNTDNSTVVETKETKKDGSTTESKKETTADGKVTETSKVVGKKANTVTESSKVTNADGTYKETTTTTNADNSKETVVSEKKVNSAKNPIEVTTVTKESAEGAKTVEQTSTIKLNDKEKAVVKVNTDAEGNTEATAEVEKTGTKLKSGATKGVIAGSAVAQIKEAAEAAEDVTIKTVIKDANGKKVFTVTADTEDMKAGNTLYILKTGKNGKQTLVNAVKYTVTKNGGVTVSLKVKGNFELVTKAEKDSLVKEIKKTIAPAKKVKTVKKGKKTTMTLKKTLDKANVKSITYNTMNKKVATVNKAGKVTAKKKGTATIKATVTLKDGSYKTVTTKIKVK